MGVYKTWLNAVADNVANMDNVTTTSSPAFQERFVSVAAAVDSNGMPAVVHDLAEEPFFLNRTGALAHLDGLPDLQEALGRLLHDDAGGLQQEHEARRRAVQHGHLVGIDVDDEVVQPQPGAGR